MFTGLVEEVAKVRRIEHRERSAELELEARVVLTDVHIGDSIAVNGVCLTVTRFTDRVFVVDAVPETMRRTNLGNLKPGDCVNVERAMQIGRRFGGHIVSGHVDGVGRLRSATQEGLAVNLDFEVPAQIGRYIVEKGSICIDGISLTVAGVQSSGFQVSIIPHTHAQTTLNRLAKGSLVNLEVDIIAKYVERLLGFGPTVGSDPTGDLSSRPEIDLAFLTKHGFS